MNLLIQIRIFVIEMFFFETHFKVEEAGLQLAGEKLIIRALLLRSEDEPRDEGLAHLLQGLLGDLKGAFPMKNGETPQAL